MQQLATQGIYGNAQAKLTDFFSHLCRASKRALLLDYDGTLAPFSKDRHKAVPYPQVPPLLEQVRDRANTRLVVVTGRRALEVASLLGLKHIEIWGCHGLSRMHSDGTYELPDVEQQALAEITEANRLLRREGLFDLLEFKPAGTAVHWRGLEPWANQIARRVERVWSKLHDRKGLRLLKFDGGMEIRAATRNKGDAVRTILSEMGGGTAMAYLGDDHTDEDGFAALQGYGLGILVHEAYRPTVAKVWIRPPEGLIAFLNDWLEACGGAS